MAAHFAHEAEQITSKVAEAAETATHATRRAITQGRRNIERVRDAAEDRVRRAPFIAIGAAFTAGIGAAILVGQCARALRREGAAKEW
jgi:ElaB/YqjD/DUF883 family membrane-anchored ribosome-binding protein